MKRKGSGRYPDPGLDSIPRSEAKSYLSLCKLNFFCLPAGCCSVIGQIFQGRCDEPQQKLTGRFDLIEENSNHLQRAVCSQLDLVPNNFDLQKDFVLFEAPSRCGPYADSALDRLQQLRDTKGDGWLKESLHFFLFSSNTHRNDNCCF